MSIQTPKINRIIRLTEFDLLKTAIKQYNMYMCLDSRKLYYDVDTSRRVVYGYTPVKTLNDLYNNIIPSAGVTYYCWEDNSLWLWMNRWISIYTDSTYPSAYQYTDDNVLDPVYRYDQANMPADDNGLLKDGSVVIRDRNRIIKGKMYIADNNDNFVLSSFLGGGMLFLPNGKLSTAGELYLSDFDRHTDSQETEEQKYSSLRSELHLIDNDYYVDYSANPELDDNKYQNDSHIYKVYHEGNLDSAALEILTPLDIYNKLLDTSLPSVFQFNVAQLNGKTDSDFAPTIHTHVASDILDFNTKSQQQAELALRTILNNMTGQGVDITYYSASSEYIISADDFNVTLTGGVYGSGTVQHLTDVSIFTTVDPNQHIHQDYIDRMDLLQDQIDDIVTINPDNYYTKSQIDTQITNVTGTTVPTSGKPLLVNDNLVLPGTSQTAQALDHSIGISLTGELNGSATLDTTQNTITIETTLVPGDNILQTSDLGVTVPTLDSNGKIPVSQIPSISSGLSPQGEFNPNQGAPSTTPEEGQFWIANTEGVFNDNNYKVGDWCLYLNSTWTYLSTSSSVSSVNGQTGTVNISYNDVNAISNDYINYMTGSAIPANKLVITDTAGHISGASVDYLTNAFSIDTDSDSLIQILDSSSNKSTNGSNNISLNIGFTDNAYQVIREKSGYTLRNNGSEIPYLGIINFADGFNITQDDTGVTNISAMLTNGSNVTCIDYDNLSSQQLLDTLTSAYNNIDNTSIIIFSNQDNNYIYFTIDKNTPKINDDQTELQLELQSNIINGNFETSQDNTSIITCDILRYTLNLTISKDEYGVYITGASINKTKDDNYNLVTKEYIDNNTPQFKSYKENIDIIGVSTYNIVHNLNTDNVLINVRDSNTKEQVYIANKIIDNNTIQLELDPDKQYNLFAAVIGI